MRVTLLFVFTYYGLRLLQIPGQQHGSGQGGQRRGLAAQDARAKAHVTAPAALAAAASSTEKPPSLPVMMAMRLYCPGCSTSRRGAPPPS